MAILLTIATPIGPLTLHEEQEMLTQIAFGDQNGTGRTPLLDEAQRQLEAYFAGRLRTFDLPYRLSGTPFQQQVYRALLDIPYGQTCSYREIARAIGRENACRAVGGANNKNRLPILIPCHRVIGQNGSLTGYAGGLAAKQFLLQLEQTGGNNP